MADRQFHIGDIVTVITGCMVASGGIGAIHELLDYMTSEQLFTHQLPRACDECAPSLKEQFPDLAAVKMPKLDGAEAWRLWLDDLAERLGEVRVVRPLSAPDHTYIDPLAELRMLGPDRPVIVVVTDPERRRG